MPDKRYQDCMAEIVAVLNKYDMGGFAIVLDKERSMFRFEWPKWCVIKTEGDGIRFRSKREDYPSTEAQHQAVERSVSLVMSLRDICAQSFAGMEQVYRMLAQHFEIDHTPFKDFDPEDGFTPERKN